MTDELTPAPDPSVDGAGALETGPRDMGTWVKVRQKVAFSHCDPAGIVFTGRIVDYALEAIEEFWKVVLDGQSWFHLNVDHGIGTSFVNVQVDFQNPVTARAAVETEVRVLRKGETSLTFAVRGSQLGEQVFSGTLTCAFIKKGHRASIRPPDWIAASLQRFLPSGGDA